MATISFALVGNKEVLAKLKENQDKIASNVEKALKAAGLKLQRESQKVVPVNYGILKASAFTRAEGKGMATKVTVGYTAAYALYVHEAIAMKLKGQPRPKGQGRYWDPQGVGQAKFLEQPLRRLLPEIKKDISNALKVS